MASDRQAFRRASQRWRELHQRHEYSDDPGAGKGAVVVACSATNINPHDPSSRRLQEAYEEDAYNVSKYLEESEGVEFTVHLQATREMMKKILADRAVASIVTIGSGNLSSLHFDLSHKRDIDWVFIALHTTHLKQGFFIQRQCGLFSRTLSVPLGTFALADQSNVFAAPDTILPTRIDVEDERIVKLHSYQELNQTTVQRLFRKDALLDSTIPRN